MKPRTGLSPPRLSRAQTLIPACPFEVVVPYTGSAATSQALAAATELAQGLQPVITLVAIHIVPYPAPLEIQPGVRARLEAELYATSRGSATTTRAVLVFAREFEAAYQQILQPQSLVVIGIKRRWWPSRAQRLARRLAALGHHVAIITA